MKKLRVLIVALIAAVLGSYFVFDLERFVSLAFVQSQLGVLQDFREENFALSAAIYFLVYVVMAAFSIPAR